MKIIMEYMRTSLGSTREVLPIVYGSVEGAIAEFHRACMVAFFEHTSFMFAGREFWPYDFMTDCGEDQEPKFWAPTFLELNAWFENGVISWKPQD